MGKKFSDVISIYIYIIFAFIILMMDKSNFNSAATDLYVILLFAYLWMGALIVISKVRYNLYVFEPLFFVSILYLGIFIYKPLIDLRASSMIEHGIDVMGGGVKATVIVVVSFTIMFFSYYGSHHRIVIGRMNGINEEDEYEFQTSYSIQNNTMLYVGWIVVFGLCLVCMLSQGLSLRYIFSLGVRGEKVIDEGNTVLLFLSNFGITSITLWFMIIVRSKNTIAKVLISVLEILYLLIRNARWLILVLIMAPVIFYYTKRKKSPNVLLIAGGAVLLLAIFSWMQINRAGVAFGNGYSGWGENGFSLETLLVPFESDFNTYKVFYSMVTRFPSIYPYMLGTTFMYVIILFVPRAVWRGKPDNPVRDMIEHSLNSYARQSGSATCNLGEMYANFGIVGCVVGMYFVGWLLQYLKSYLYSSNEERLIVYSIMYPLLFQWIARGNFSGNYYMTIFAILPFILKKIAVRR